MQEKLLNIYKSGVVHEMVDEKEFVFKIFEEN